jgi:hypothetical protein
VNKYSPDSTILIVDSYSDDYKVFQELQELPNVVISPKKNKNFEAGAFWIAHELYPDEDLLILQDSIIVSYDLNFLKEKDFFCFSYQQFQWFENCEILEKFLNNGNFTLNTSNNLIFGNSFYLKNKYIKQLKEKNIHTLLPINKKDSCAMERLWGMILTQIGLDIENNSFIHQNFLAESTDNSPVEIDNQVYVYQNKFFTKYILSRK